MRAAALVALAAALLVGAPASAHWVSPDDVVDGLREPATRSLFGIVDARRDPRLPRLLVIEVGPAWEDVDPELRRQAAEAWLALWREAAPTGVLAIVDAAGRSRVGFDALGHAQIRAAEARPSE